MQTSQELTAPGFLDALGFELAELRQQLDSATTLAARIIEDAAEGIMITDTRNIIRTVNPAFERATGYRADEVIGQTPAYCGAFADGVTVTDESMAVERLGLPVACVEGSPRNRKLTTPGDLEWAERLVQDGLA
jgi:PAS domain S-box-containing protein